MRNLYLTTQESKALQFLAQGTSTLICRRELDIPRARWDRFTLRLRQKTGIADHKDERQCQDYLRRYSDAPMTLTSPQLEIFRRLIRGGETIEGAAYQMKITQEDARQLVNDGCTSVGIFTQHVRTRLLQMRTYLSVYHSTNGKPITETELAALRLVAKGYRPQQVYLELGGNERYFVDLIRGVCLRLGFNVQGRGTQRNMIIDYLARLDANQYPEIEQSAPVASSVTMDDPAF